MEKLEDKLISVIVPVYNVEKYIVKCLDSLRAQSYRNVEILLIDDGSADESGVLCDCYARIDGRIRVIHKENGGLSSARNAGLDAASGEYVYFLDSDDYIEPRLLEKAVTAMESAKIDWCGFWAVKEDEDADILYQIAFEEKQEDIRDEQKRFAFLLERFLNYYTGWEACFHIYRRSVIEDAGLRFVSERKVFAEDLLFSFCYLLHAKSYLILPEIFYHYVERKGSLMQKKGNNNILPFIYNLGCEAYKEVQNAGLEFIENQFGLIYMALLEWHTRPYISRFGSEWVQRELNSLPQMEFMPTKMGGVGEIYRAGIAAYGARAGVITVVLPIQRNADLEQAECFIREILRQSIQRLDILLLCEGKVELGCKDFRIRYREVEKLSQSRLIRLGFAESYGEFVYFADYYRRLPYAFLERVSDAMKYNQCSTGIVLEGEESTTVLNGEFLQHRKELRQKIRCMEKMGQSMVMRKNLLEKSGLEHLEALEKYWLDIVFAGRVILINQDMGDRG